MISSSFFSSINSHYWAFSLSSRFKENFSMEGQAHQNNSSVEASDQIEEDEDVINVVPYLDVPPSLPFGQTLGFSIGHVLNDLCSGVWFSYLLVYMTLVIKFSNENAGALLMIGQVADGISTPIVGIYSQKIRFWKYGRKKSWHLLGSMCVIMSFPLIFNPCIFGGDVTVPYQMVYFSIFIIIFQFGWAAVQISHLSLIPDLTSSSNERIGLNSLRYSFTVASSITVYMITWLVLSFDDDSKSSREHSLHTNRNLGKSQIGPDDAPRFRILVLSILSLGSVFSTLFHFIVSEPDHSCSENTDGSIQPLLSNNSQLAWKDWLTIPKFYNVGLLYTASRICLNITQVYIPFYLHFTLGLDKTSVAYIPLILYISGFFTSLITKKVDNVLGKKFMYACGALLSLGTFYFLPTDRTPFYSSYGIYIVVALLGASGSIILICSLGITNDLIGNNIKSGAFVIGGMSFFDKVTNGLGVMLIQSIHPTDDATCQGHEEFYRNVLMYACGSANIVSLFALSCLVIKSKDKTKRCNSLERNETGNINREETHGDSDTDPLIDV
ncbi:major facilitator superfamily domain-containing protein 12-like [Brevipalpus obovatus]|uniref:major facilitator superfamily domain-containing protein 12-like n=1 Tax=Brevipalpus obovatus TaxID=246614 RepID=UPI003D9E37F1